jgi:heme/copper-type cytochrome/quinol oxidase subunit 1
MELKGTQSRMAGLFLYAAMVQGAIAAVITFLGAVGNTIGVLPVAVAFVIASGEAGTWFTVGYLTYLIVGVVAMAVTSLFYFYIETVQGKVYKGAAKSLAWIHLVLGNIGVAGAALLAMIGGYLGGAAMQPARNGGMGWTTLQVHENILQYYPNPIAAFLLLGLLGFFCGGVGYLIAMRSK